MTYFNSVCEINKRKACSIRVLDSEYLQHQDDNDRHLDGPKDKDTMPFNDAMKQMEEVYDAAHAIGAKGVTGINTPAVLLFFFMFALKINQTLYSNTQLYNNAVNKITEKPVVHQKTGWGWVKKKLSVTNRVTQVLKHLMPSCYKYLLNDYCYGLCGPECIYWSFL